jgi:hypothetical protein
VADISAQGEPYAGVHEINGKGGSQRDMVGEKPPVSAGVWSEEERGANHGPHMPCIEYDDMGAGEIPVGKRPCR